eukprot:9183066-Lingulodinium_polyedra.AAC.1
MPHPRQPLFASPHGELRPQSPPQRPAMPPTSVECAPPSRRAPLRGPARQLMAPRAAPCRGWRDA